MNASTLIGLASIVLLATALSKHQIEDEINDYITKHKVTVFSKTYCPYSRRLKLLLKKYPIEDMEIVELDTRDEMSDMQDALSVLTGRRTVPQLFVNGDFVGGSDDAKEMETRGELKQLLQEAGAINDE